MITRLRRFTRDSTYRRKIIRWIFHLEFRFTVAGLLQNVLIRSFNKLPLASRSHCQVCGWNGWSFETITTVTYLRQKARCPQCGALERHRALFELVAERAWIRPGITLLDIAPSGFASRYLVNQHPLRYVSIDLGDIIADIRGDVQHLPFPRQVFDLIFCFHVLEFVPDWVGALNEFRRILNPDGVLVLSENYLYGQSKTIEFDQERLMSGSPPRRFGDDLLTTLQGLGYSVERYDYLNHYDETGDYFFICQPGNFLIP